MPTDDKMSIDERRKYLTRMYPRYRDADYEAKRRLLDEMEAYTGLHRKSLLRLLTPDGLERRPRQRQRGSTYDHTVDDALRVVAESLDNVCAERLHGALGWLPQHLAQHGELNLTDELAAQLARISIPTIRRHLARLQQDEPHLKRKRPTRNAVAADIPIRRIPWDEPTPGHFEVDLVHHCGPSTDGDYVHTLQMLDVLTGWSERVAVFGRSQRAMVAAFERIEARLPFPLLEVHSDNGSEFLNAHLVRYFRQRVKLIDLSRSRPYHKNDNRFVEQKNSTLVRAFFGDERLDTVLHQRLLDKLYEAMWLYYNFFQPVLRLTEKECREQDGAMRFRRTWGEAMTALDRLCAAQGVDEAAQAALKGRRASINPRQLRAEIYELRDKVLDLPPASRPADGWLIH